MFSKKTKLGSPKPFSPATIDERHSFNAALEQQEEAPPISSLLVTPKDATSLSTGLTVHAMRLWDIKMGPIKKHMVGSRLVPTVRQVAFFNNKIRKISVEIQGPPTSADKTPPQLQTLQDGQVVFLRVFKRSRRGATTPSAATENGDDDDDDMSVASTVIGGDIQELAANAMIDGWREHRSYKLEDVHILSQNKNTRVLEVKLGSGQETMVRDFRFESEEDSKSFRAVVDSINQMEQERSQRQLAKYKESKVAAAAKTSPTGASSAKAVQEDSVGQEMIQILVEIVSAIDLPEADLSSADPYVIVRMGGKEIHRTAVIAKNLHPIWTLSEGSLFLLRMTPEEFFASSGGMTFVIKDFDQIGKNEILGNVFVPLEDLLKGTGERMEYEVKPEKVTKPKPGAKQGKLYLRFREASADDIAFMDVFSKRSDRVGVFSEETIVPLRPPSSKLLKRQVKRGEHKEKLVRLDSCLTVSPYTLSSLLTCYVDIKVSCQTLP